MAKKKNKKKEGPADAPAYMQLYVCLMMILVALFCVLLSNASFEDEVTKEQVKASLKGGFGVLDGGFKLEEGSEILFPSPDLVEKTEEIKQHMHRYMEIIKKKKEEQETKTLTGFKEYIRAKKTGGFLDVGLDQDNVIITIGSMSIFDPGQVSISETGKDILRSVAVMIKRVSYPVIVEGHTDNWPISSKRFPSNWELSMVRAVNVVKFLIKDTNIVEDRLAACGYGEYAPLVPNTNKENMAKNRRIRIVFVGAAKQA